MADRKADLLRKIKRNGHFSKMKNLLLGQTNSKITKTWINNDARVVGNILFFKSTEKNILLQERGNLFPTPSNSTSENNHCADNFDQIDEINEDIVEENIVGENNNINNISDSAINDNVDNVDENDFTNNIVDGEEYEYLNEMFDIVEGCNPTEEKKLNIDLANWAIKHQIKHSAVNAILKIFKTHYPDAKIPNDARVLVQTPRKSEIVQFEGEDAGQYWHYGLEKVLADLLKGRENKIPSDGFLLNVNIDGLPMFKSSKTSFWPILVELHEWRNKTDTI